jgi:YD repeat-containing protein
VTDPLSRTTQLAEDALGRLAGVTDPLGLITQHCHDAIDRLTSVTNAMGGLTALQYDPNGNLLTVTDPRNVVQTFTYVSRDRRHTYQDPAGHVETDSYDGMSNLTSVVDRKGQTTSITYDGIDRPKLITFQDSSTIAITWDGGNRPTQFVDSLNGTISRTHDLLDRLTQETSPQGQVSYTYPQGLFLCDDWKWMAFDWALGLGDRNRSYGAESDQVQQLKSLPIVNWARQRYQQKNAGNKGGCCNASQLQGVTNVASKFGIPQFIQATMQGNCAWHFIGSFSLDVTPVSCSQARFTITNNSSFKSFSYGAGPSWNGGPMGNFNQTYTWDESL